MKKFLFSSPFTVLAVLIFTVLGIGPALAPGAPLSGSISGTVYAPPGGLPPAGTQVKLLGPDRTATVIWKETTVDSGTGQFTLSQVPNGMYLLVAVPPQGTGWTSSIPMPVKIFNNNLSGLHLDLTRPQIQGKVLPPVGNTPTPAILKLVYARSVPLPPVSSPDGNFEIGGLTPGTYQVQAAPDSSNPYWYSETISVNVTASSSSTVELRLTAAQLYGTVRDGQANNVSGALVLATTFTNNQAGAGQLGSEGFQVRTRPDGYWAPGGLRNGSYKLTAFPPADRPDLQPSVPQTVTLPGAGNPIPLTLSSLNKIVQGLVKMTSDVPVQKARVLARGVDRICETFVLTGTDGTYQLKLRPGTWSLTVQPTADAIPQGTVRNALTNALVTGVGGRVAAHQERLWAGAPIQTRTGSFRIPATAGLWRLAYSIDPKSGYVQASQARTIAVTSGGTTEVPLPVLEKNARLQGQVLDPDGKALANTVVFARTERHGSREMEMHGLTDSTGKFDLALPAGPYRLGARLLVRTELQSNGEWLQPAERKVEIQNGQTSAGHTLRFRRSDAVLSGTLTLENSTASGRALVWAWSQDGQAAHGSADMTAGQGTYQLKVVAGTNWKVGAVFETSTEYWSGTATLDVIAGSNTQDILLQGPHAKPAPVAVTFDAAEPQSIALADGTGIYIPAGALPATGAVTLRIVPHAGIPGQTGTDVFRFGYAFLATDELGQAIEQTFLQEVEITFGYTDAELASLGISESSLRPAYFSTTENMWVIPENYIVDPSANQITLMIDHFTDFSLISGNGNWLYLPAVFR